MAGIQKEVWAADIKEKLFPDDSFLMHSEDVSSWVDGLIVHRPNAGENPEVQKNRTVLPAPMVKRNDTVATYMLDEFTSTPSLIRDIEAAEVSYKKRASELKSHIKSLNKEIANAILASWATGLSASSIIKTTGDVFAANTPGATGNRKALTLEDLSKVKRMFNDQDIPSKGRVAVLASHQYEDLIINHKEILLSREYRADADIRNGELYSLFGFKIYTRGRNNCLRFNAAGDTVIDPMTAGAANDNAASLFWHPDFVERAKGNVKVFYNEDEATLYGDVFSAMAIAGGQKSYVDGTGVVAIVEDTAA